MNDQILPGSTAHSHGYVADAGVPVQTRSERLRSANPGDHNPVNRRDEQWRYLEAPALDGLDTATLSNAIDAIRVEAPAEFRIEQVDAEDRDFGRAGLPEDLPTANGWAAATKALKVTVAGEANDPATISISNPGRHSAAHLILKSETFARGVIVLDHTGDATISETVEIIVGDESQLTVISLQDWNDSAVHTSAQFARIGRNAKLKHVVVSLGGKTVRVSPVAEFTAPGGEVELLGTYFADAGQFLEHRSYVDHAVANCKSRVTYKGALQGEGARTVWVGDVLIRQAAEGTDTYELNRNLLLTDGARADSVPNLEIETGEIEGAGHASASGRFDDEQLFYLQARGINSLDARRLVVRGFLNEVIQQIGIESIEARLNESIEAELAESSY
ncbi:MAG: Fe-S cluster assembly protein SufD [Micrococcales bacterium]